MNVPFTNNIASNDKETSGKNNILFFQKTFSTDFENCEYSVRHSQIVAQATSEANKLIKKIL